MYLGFIEKYDFNFKKTIVSLTMVIISLLLMKDSTYFYKCVCFPIITGFSLYIHFTKSDFKRLFFKFPKTIYIKTPYVKNKKINARYKETGIMFLLIKIIIISLMVSILSALLGQLLGVNINSHTTSGNLEKTKEFFMYGWISLIGEEFLKYNILFPFVFLTSKKFSLKVSILISSIVACAIFGLLHFGAYGWNIYHLIFVIGLSSLIWLYAFYKTGNISTTIFIHIMYDFIVFAIAM